MCNCDCKKCLIATKVFNVDDCEFHICMKRGD